eukprot:5304881-Alexandrium_andersonii.AAC.1
MPRVFTGGPKLLLPRSPGMLLSFMPCSCVPRAPPPALPRLRSAGRWTGSWCKLVLSSSMPGSPSFTSEDGSSWPCEPIAGATT